VGAADDFLKSLLQGHPEIQSGKVNEQPLSLLLSSHQRKVNSTGLEDFDGLSPEQMHRLLNAPLEQGSLLSIKAGSESYLNKVPLFKLSELLLSEIQTAKEVKLTARDNLPVRICELLHSQGLIQWDFMQYLKRIREEEIPYIWPLKQYLLDTGSIKKRKNSLSLTKQGETFLRGPAVARFNSLFDYFSSQFHWGNFYALDDGGKCGQLGWAYSLFLLSRYGSKPLKSEFYSLKWMRAFDKELWQADQQESETQAVAYYHSAYAVRFFECFANWFGLVKIEKKPSRSHIFLEEVLVTKTMLFDQLLDFKHRAYR
jgi:hypothetical protein